MNALAYYLRVFIISYEFLALIFCLTIYLYFDKEIVDLATSTTINEDALGWLVLYPAVLATWMLKEGVSILFPGDKMNKDLHMWQDYWRLKAHFNVGIFYAISLSTPCIYIWATNNFTTGWGLSLFMSCVLSISMSALSFYKAILKVKELLIHVE